MPRPRPVKTAARRPALAPAHAPAADGLAGPKPKGRPRDPTARAAVLAAARKLLAEGGVAAVSIEALSARTGVSKPTIYRSWPNAQAVVMTALMDQLDARMSALPRGDPVAILRGQLRDIARVFAARSGRHVASMLASADPASELGRAFRNHFILARRQEGRAILERAVRDGHLRADLDLEVALDLLYAPIFYRLLLGHAPLDDAFGEAVVDHLITGLGGRKQPRRRGSSSR